MAAQIGGIFEYTGCDYSGGAPRSCTQLQLNYQFFWNPYRNGYEGGPSRSGTTQFFTPGTVDCGLQVHCNPQSSRFLVGSVAFLSGGCPECLWSDVPNPASLAPAEIDFDVAYGPDGMLYDPRAKIVPPGTIRVSYVLTRVTTAPEPGTIALTASGLLGVALLARRRVRA